MQDVRRETMITKQPRNKKEIKLYMYMYQITLSLQVLLYPNGLIAN